MAQSTSTKSLSALSKNEFLDGSGTVDLELPDGHDFDPEPQALSPDLCIESCEQWLPTVLAQPGFWERREAERCPAEFDLDDPTRVPILYPAEFIDELLRRE